MNEKNEKVIEKMIKRVDSNSQYGLSNGGVNGDLLVKIAENSVGIEIIWDEYKIHREYSFIRNVIKKYTSIPN